MTGLQPARARIQAPELEAHDNALADLRAAESLISQAMVWAQSAQWAEPMRADLGRLRINLRNLLQDLA